jgi:hypothetical protein
MCGEFQPYFGKQSDYQAHSPQEPKRADLRGFPLVQKRSGNEYEPEQGLFSPGI